MLIISWLELVTHGVGASFWNISNRTPIYPCSKPSCRRFPIAIEILVEELILPTSADTFVLQRAIDEASTAASAVSDLVEADNNWFRDPQGHQQ